MSELRKTDRAEHSPNRCFRCQRGKGPFVSLGITTFDLGELYLCAGYEGACARQIGRLDDMLDPEAAANLRVQIADRDDKIEELRGQNLEAERRAVSRFADFLRSEGGHGAQGDPATADRRHETPALEKAAP